MYTRSMCPLKNSMISSTVGRSWDLMCGVFKKHQHPWTIDDVRLFSNQAHVWVMHGAKMWFHKAFSKHCSISSSSRTYVISSVLQLYHFAVLTVMPIQTFFTIIFLANLKKIDDWGSDLHSEANKPKDEIAFFKISSLS